MRNCMKADCQKGPEKSRKIYPRTKAINIKDRQGACRINNRWKKGSCKLSIEWVYMLYDWTWYYKLEYKR